MKFGSREIANVVFRAKQDTKIGNMTFANRQPVLYIDTAKTSTVEGAADATYANGGRGNPRLITWEGNKTVTFTVEDALLSPTGFAILSGAGLIHGSKVTKYDKGSSSSVSVASSGLYSAINTAITSWDTSSGLTIASPFTSTVVGTMIDEVDEPGESTTKSLSATTTIPSGTDALTFLYTLTIKQVGDSKYTWIVNRALTEGSSVIVHVHKTIAQTISNSGEIDLSSGLTNADIICDTAPLFIMVTEEDGSLTGEYIDNSSYTVDSQSITVTDTSYYNRKVLVDFYVKRSSAEVYELQINAEDFAGSYYVEAETLFRRQDTGADLPAIFTLPNVKIQSNWTFSMSADGDPSTFTFTMDAMPDYTYFDTTKKMLCVIQIVDDNSTTTKDYYTVMGHGADSSENI